MGLCPLQPPLGKGQGEACLGVAISCLAGKNQGTLAGCESMEAVLGVYPSSGLRRTREGGLLFPLS